MTQWAYRQSGGVILVRRAGMEVSNVTIRFSLVPVVLALVAVVACGGCTDRDVESFENGLWHMFAGHPKPIILKKPSPPVYCYETIGTPVCYAEPQDPDDPGLAN